MASGSSHACCLPLLYLRRRHASLKGARSSRPCSTEEKRQLFEALLCGKLKQLKPSKLSVMLQDTSTIWWTMCPTSKWESSGSLVRARDFASLELSKPECQTRDRWNTWRIQTQENAWAPFRDHYGFSRSCVLIIICFKDILVIIYHHGTLEQTRTSLHKFCRSNSNASIHPS